MDDDHDFDDDVDALTQMLAGPRIPDIEAYLTRWCEDGALRPFYDVERGQLVLDNAVSDDYAYDFVAGNLDDIDDAVTFDIDRSHRVVRVQLDLPRDAWPASEYTPITPTCWAALCLGETLLRTGSGTVAHTTMANPAGTWLLISFGESPRTTRSQEAAALSEECVALMSGGHLQGLQVELPDVSTSSGRGLPPLKRRQLHPDDGDILF